MSGPYISVAKSVNNPQVSDVHVNAPLTTFSQAWFTAREAKMLASVGVCPSAKRSDVYFEWSAEDTLRLISEPRAVGAPAVQIGVNVSATNSFTCDIYGAAWPMEDEVAANADAALQLDQSAVDGVSEAAMRREETEMASVLFATGSWGSNYGTPSTLWSAAGSDPVADIAAQYDAILKTTGRMPNVLMVGHYVMSALKRNASILNRLGLGGNPTDPRMVTEAALASLFGVERVIESTVVANSANPGGTASYDFVVGKHALLAHVPAGNALRTPSAFKRFVWTGWTGSADGRRVIRYRVPPRTDVIEIEHAFKTKVTSTSLGYLFASAVS